MEKFPISLYASVTPNPYTIKFMSDRYLLQPKQGSADFRTKEEADGFSPLASAVFEQFYYIKGVYIERNFISVTKDEGAMPWEYLIPEVRDFLHSYIVNGNPIVNHMPEERAFPKVKDMEFSPSPFDGKIRELMKTHVDDPVREDGGQIVYRGFKDGIVTVLLKGACVGCPARNKTLKQGIEDILIRYIPEVKEVVSENDLLEEENNIATSSDGGKSPFDQLDFSAFDSLPEI